MASFFPNIRVFGLDIGAHSIKAALVSGQGSKYRITSVNEVGLDRNPWLKTGLRDKEILTQKIRELIQTAKPSPIHLQDAVCSLSESSVFSKVIKLPKVSKKELEQTIPFEAAEFLPLPLEEVYLDWQIDETPAIIDDKPAHHVLVVAAPKRLIDELIEVTSNAGVHLVSVESEPFAICRSVKHLLQDKAPSLILTIHHNITTITLATSKTIQFVSTVITGSEKISQSITTHLASIADEIAESIKYYHNRLGEKGDIEQIILTGTGADIVELPKELEKLTKIRTIVGNVSIALPNKETIHPRFNTVIGLALWKRKS